MGCIKGDKKKKALVAFVVLVLVQLFLVIALIVLGAKGKEEIGTDDGPGVPYYVGALVVGGVFAVPVLQLITFVILSHCEGEYCITSCLAISVYLLNFFGILACILGMIFVIAFGIANCKKDPDSTDYTDTGGFCSYATNIDTNYTIAVLALVCILFMLPTTCCTFYVVSKNSENLGVYKDSPSASPTNYATAPGQPTPTAPPLYPPPGTGRQPGLDGTEDPPPSYESVMRGQSSSNSASDSNAASTQQRYEYNPFVHSSNTPQLSLAEQMTRHTQ